ncbi:MAG TPA: T9SS type A sorting domain-containing protein [Flavobacterium sp.]|jgi:hypothetical protein
MNRNLQKWILKAGVALTLLISANSWSQTYYNLQWPANGSITETGSMTAYAQAWQEGVTEAAGAGAGLEAWIGISPEGENSNPNTWTMWVPATFNIQVGNNDEFMASIGANLAPGTYYYASRFRLNNGSYKYGGFSGGEWNGSSNVSGVLTVASNPDCTTVWYMDADGDGFGGDQTITGCNQPEGYVSANNDCNDSNPNLFNNSDVFVDADGDGYTEGAAADLCYGAELPDGYTHTTLGADCDDSDATVWQSTSLFVDNDGDGYYGDIQDNICWGNEVPEGYVVETLGHDCDDTNANVYNNADLFVDSDGDGYTEGPAADVCYGAEIPEGYAETSLGADCDDTDATKWRTADMYIDGDGDGYHSDNVDAVCYGDTVPAGYSLTTEGFDCDDENASINLGATEITGNGIDENCNGMDDDGVGQHFTHLKASQCGSTLPRIYTALVAEVNTANVTMYRFEVTNTTTGEKQTYVGTDYYVQLTDLDSYEYGTTYSVRVGMDVDGVWQGYGPACSVTTPSLFQGPVAINISQCGTTLAQRNSPIFITGPHFISSTQIRVTNLSTTQSQTITRSESWFTLKMFPALYDYNTSYSIEVRVATTEGYSEWTTACTVTTPGAPAGKFADSTASIKVVAYPNPFNDAFSISIDNTDRAAVQVKVYDMMGKLLEVRDMEANNIEAQRLGSNLPAGVYNVVVTQDGTAESVRVIKR